MLAASSMFGQLVRVWLASTATTTIRPRGLEYSITRAVLVVGHDDRDGRKNGGGDPKADMPTDRTTDKKLAATAIGPAGELRTARAPSTKASSAARTPQWLRDVTVPWQLGMTWQGKAGVRAGADASQYAVRVRGAGDALRQRQE